MNYPDVPSWYRAFVNIAITENWPKDNEEHKHDQRIEADSSDIGPEIFSYLEGFVLNFIGLCPIWVKPSKNCPGGGNDKKSTDTQGECRDGKG
ncbi:hypothetical protein A3729_09170 [Oleiphilus sp. HI0043]|nr:hypothetical protein A3729_09170 [Oleiphilus sp. HI0043]KZZ62070.1 hypothetical protein A3763_08525 [Oleiphilus sp. HI0128]